jgi:MFS family permease
VALLSLILPHIQIDFELTSWQTDQVAMSIFAGQMAGCFVMGALADAIGRRPCSIMASAMVAGLHSLPGVRLLTMRTFCSARLSSPFCNWWTILAVIIERCFDCKITR